MKRAAGNGYTSQSRFLFCERASALVGPQQVPAFHQCQARAALAVAPNLASRTDRKLALAYRAQPLELRRVIPDIVEFLSPQIPRRLGQLHAWKDITVRRDVATVVARAARLVLVSPAFHSARNGAPQRRRQGVHGGACLRAGLRLAGMPRRIPQYRQQPRDP